MLQSWHERQTLPPRGLRLRGEALRRSAAPPRPLRLLAAHGSDLELPPSDSYRRWSGDWQAASLTQAAHADELQQRWQALSPRQREQRGRAASPMRGAPARSGLEAEAATALADAIERALGRSAGAGLRRVAAARATTPRLARAQSWLAAHPDSAALALAPGPAGLRAQQLGKARRSR